MPGTTRHDQSVTPEGRRPRVTERLIALTDGGAEARFRGALLERVALRGVPRDAVEDRADQLGGVQALAVDLLGLASSAITSRSEYSARSVPPATQNPWTLHMRVRPLRRSGRSRVMRQIRSAVS